MKAENDDNVRMILTGYTDVKDLIDCINAGLIYRYLVKPWNADEIKGVVRQAMDVISQEDNESNTANADRQSPLPDRHACGEGRLR